MTQTSASNMQRQRGWSLPLSWILVVGLGLAIWFWGWWALAVTVAAAALITAGTWIYDKLTHDRNCRWCNHIKATLAAEQGIPIGSMKTKHVGGEDMFMFIEVNIDDGRCLTVSMDYNCENLEII
jgi:membrane protein YdbS with pleckstrin-like domain